MTSKEKDFRQEQKINEEVLRRVHSEKIETEQERQHVKQVRNKHLEPPDLEPDIQDNRNVAVPESDEDEKDIFYPRR